ncbi:hypothetical protein, partial [Caulobacter sp.]|uniref:hypothetical protein n=1 Tax=Caulobacter sp. TaxID=78 RepID=UPI001B21BDED
LIVVTRDVANDSYVMDQLRGRERAEWGRGDGRREGRHVLRQGWSRLQANQGDAERQHHAIPETPSNSHRVSVLNITSVPANVVMTCVCDDDKAKR